MDITQIQEEFFDTEWGRTKGRQKRPENNFAPATETLRCYC
jgi:hypothetical protein